MPRGTITGVQINEPTKKAKLPTIIITVQKEGVKAPVKITVAKNSELYNQITTKYQDDKTFKKQVDNREAVKLPITFEKNKKNSSKINRIKFADSSPESSEKDKSEEDKSSESSNEESPSKLKIKTEQKKSSVPEVESSSPSSPEEQSTKPSKVLLSSQIEEDFYSSEEDASKKEKNTVRKKLFSDSEESIEQDESIEDNYSEEENSDEDSKDEDYIPPVAREKRGDLFDKRLDKFKNPGMIEPRDPLDKSLSLKDYDLVTLSLNQVSASSYTQAKGKSKQGILFDEKRNKTDIAGFIKVKEKTSKMYKNAEEYLVSTLDDNENESYFKRRDELSEKLQKRYPQHGADFYYYQQKVIAKIEKNLQSGRYKNYQTIKQKKEDLARFKTKEGEEELYEKFINKKIRKAEWLHSIADSLGSNPLAFWNASSGTYAANTQMAAIETAIAKESGIGVEVKTYLRPGTKCAEWYKYTVFVNDGKGHYDRIVFHIDARREWYDKADLEQDQKKISKFLNDTYVIRSRYGKNPPDINPPVLTQLELKNADSADQHFYPREGTWVYSKIGAALASTSTISTAEHTEFLEFLILSNKDIEPEYTKLKQEHEEHSKTAAKLQFSISQNDQANISKIVKSDPQAVNYCYGRLLPITSCLDPNNPKPEIAIFLIKHNANLHVSNTNGDNLLHMALQIKDEKSREDIIKALLEKDKLLHSRLIDERNNDCKTPHAVARELLGDHHPLTELLKTKVKSVDVVSKAAHEKTESKTEAKPIPSTTSSITKDKQQTAITATPIRKPDATDKFFNSLLSNAFSPSPTWSQKHPRSPIVTSKPKSAVQKSSSSEVKEQKTKDKGTKLDSSSADRNERYDDSPPSGYTPK